MRVRTSRRSGPASKSAPLHLGAVPDLLREPISASRSPAFTRQPFRPLSQSGAHLRCVTLSHLLTPLAAWLVLLCAAVSLCAQTTFTESVVSDAPGNPLADLIQASDGNFYGTTANGGTNNLGSIFQLTPAGVLTTVYSFSGTDGSHPTSGVIEGPHGYLYGTTDGTGKATDPDGFGTIYDISPNGWQLETLYAFTGGTDGAGPKGALVQGSDGYFYGTTTGGGDLSVFNPSGVFYRISPEGVYTVMATFTGPESGTIADQAGTMLQGADGNFYGTSELGGTGGYGGVGVGSVFSVSAAGAATLLYNFTGNADGYGPNYPPLVQLPDGSFYGTTPNSYQGTGGGIVFQYTPGNIAQAHGFSNVAGGGAPYSGLTLASDGNLYGATHSGGLATCKNPDEGGFGCGTFYQINPVTYAFATLYAFGPSPDASEPFEGTPIQASDGNFYGVTYGGGSGGTGAVYKIAASPSLPPPIQLSFSDPNPVPINVPVLLTWKVLNAFSTTAQQCVAYIQGLPPGGDWSGLQTGALNQGIYGGIANITPTVGGTYTFALTCGGRQSGFATLVVSNGYKITNASLPNATVGKPYKVQLATTGGNYPNSWSIGGTVPNLPAGLTLNPATGIISGTPLQFGVQNVTFMATDGSTPPLQTTATLPLTVVSDLQITTPSLVKGTVNANYMQLLSATGGLPGLTSSGTNYYNWSIIAGKLPAGLTLGPTTGMITGKATTAGTTSLTFQVTDTETTPATATVTLNLVIAPTVQIAAVEFTQVIQQYQTLSDLQSSLTTYGEPPVPMVTGKPAVMRVYFTTVNDATSVTLTATGAVADTQPLSLTPNCQPTDARAQVAGCPSMDFYFTPPTGTWTTTLTLTDDFGNQLEQETFSITSRSTTGIALKGVSTCATGAVTACGDVTQLLGITGLALQLWPTSSVTPVLTTEWVTINAPSVLSPTGLGNFIDSALASVNQLYSWSDAVADSLGNTRTDYVGIYPNALGSGGGVAIGGGHGLMIPEDEGDPIEPEPDYLAHEIGHTLNEEHTNNGLPQLASPTTPPGCFAVAPSSNTNWPFANNEIQSGAGLTPTPEYGFNVAAGKAINPTSDFDIMAYCVPEWVSPINYKVAFISLGGGAVTSPSVGVGKGAPLAAPLTTPVTVLGPYWQISGSIGTSAVTLDPIFTQVIEGSTDPGSGTYTIQALSSTGQTLYTRYFTPDTVEPDPFDTTVVQTVEPIFSEWIPVTSGTAAIDVLDPNGNLLTSVPLTGTPPTVTITSPVAGFVGTGQQTVSWTIQSATATNFTSRIFYSIDGGTTWQQITEVTGTSDILDFSMLPGATAVLLRIDVSDGVNTGSATSVPFSVPKKLPSAIVINNPVSGAIQPAKNPVYLSGAAYDADDGVLTGAALQWTDSAQGALGSGSPLTVNLNPGNHTITLTATDSDGNAITATTQITLGGGAPAVTLTTTQVATNCINETIGAVPGAQGADLTQVNYSLDGGATYTAIPLTGLPFSFSVPGGGAINLVAVAIDASGQSSAQSTELNLGAGCAVTPPVAITPTVTVTPSPTSITTAQSAMVTVTVSGGSGNPIPTGSVTLTSGTYISAATTLTNGSAAITVPGSSLAVTTDTLTATYTPDSNSLSTYNSAMGTNSITVAAAPLPTFSLSNNGPITFEASAATGNTATITVAPANGFTGAVNLTCAVTTTPANPTSPATCAVTPSVTITGAASQNATLTVNSTTTTTPGTYAVIITGTSGAIMIPTAVNISVTAYIAPSFTLTNGGAIAINSVGATTGNTTTITVMPSGGFTGSVTLTAAIATSPKGAVDLPTFGFGATSPVNITGASNGTATITVTTTAATTGALVGPNTRRAPWYAAGGTALACLLFFAVPVRRRRRRSMLGMFLLLVLFAEGLVGCIHKNSGNSGTTTGNYTITVTGSSGSITQTTTVNLTVN